MDKSETVLHEFSSLVCDLRRVALASKEEFTDFCRIVRAENNNSAGLLESVTKHEAAQDALLSELVEKADRMREIEDKIQGLVQSQNFGFKIITAQEEERRRVAREIHDGPAQAMANVIFLAEVCEKLIEIDTDRAKRELFELRQQVRSCLTETRKIIFDLRPMVLDDLGLIPTVKKIADNLKERSGLQISVKLSGLQGQPLDSRVEVSLFRIIQESLNNVEKHAEATEVQVLMDFQHDCVTAVVRDNGKGFDPVKNNSQDSESFGLLGMRERVSLLQGELDIRSEIGAGTKIMVKIPLANVKVAQKLII